SKLLPYATLFRSGHQVLMLEERCERLDAYALRWRICGAKRGVSFLESAEFAEQLVVLPVAERWRVEYVVLVVRALQHFAQGGRARGEFVEVGVCFHCGALGIAGGWVPTIGVWNVV